MRADRAIFALIITFGALGRLMAAAPAAPMIVEPNVDGAIVSPFDVHMAITEEFTDADGDTLASTDWEIRRSSDQSLQWNAYGISDLRIWHVHFGDGTFRTAGRTALDAGTEYVLRVRFRDSRGEQSGWTTRPFTTGRLEEVFPLKLTDIEPGPAPEWVDLSSSGEILLPPAATPHILRLESCCAELFYRKVGPSFIGQSFTENLPPITKDKPLRVNLTAGSSGLVLPASRIAFTDNRFVNRNIYLPRVNLPPGQSISFWIAITGSSYADDSGTNVPTFGELVQGAPVSWVVQQPGYVVEVVSTGYQLPTSICFVPQPSGEPTAPKFYIGELYGRIKVVANNGTVSDFAKGLINYTPTTSFPGSGEMGLADVAIHPQTGEIFASTVYRSGTNFYGRVYRLPSTDGGRTMTSEPQSIFDMFPYPTGPSHQISNISFDGDGNLLVHTGDGFQSSSAQNIHDPRGKVMRMDASGQPLPSNPLYDISDGIGFADYVFSYGYRNPFGGDWRSADQALYIVENGTNENDRLSRAERGRNYGWNGNDSSMLIGAIHNWVIPVAPVQMAFIQPSVFAGSGFPASMLGRAFVTESGPTYARGPQANGKRITSFELSGSGQKLSGPDVLLSYQGTGRSTAAAIAAGPDGLYFSDLYAETGSNPVASGANILRVRFIGAADFTAKNSTGPPPLRVSFTDSSSIPEPAGWLWDFGDGTTSTERHPIHTYTRAGSFTVRLTVTAPDGASLAVKPDAVVVGDKKHILMVTGSPSLNAAEENLRQRLLNRNYLLTHLPDSAVTTDDAESKSMVLICSSVLSANVGTKFRNVGVPVLCYESHLYDDLGMTGPVSGSDYGTRLQQTQLSLSDDPEDPILRGLGRGLQTVVNSPAIFTWGHPVAGAKISALLRDTLDQAAIFRFESGASLASRLAAPARRMGLMLEDLTAGALTATGWTLVERAVDWTSNLAPQVSLQSPLPGDLVRNSEPVSIAAAISDFDGSVVRVDYFANGAPIGTTTQAPHELVWHPTQAGSYDLTARALDDQETASMSEIVRIEALHPFDFWSRQFFNENQLQEPLVGGAQGDPDRDNIANLLEYAFGFSPWEGNLPPTEAGFVEIGGQTFPVFLYRVSEHAEVELTPELTKTINDGWYTGPDHMIVEPIVAGDGYAEMRARAKMPLSHTNSSTFFRLRASTPQDP